ncbi:MAG: hypothetical protein QF628_00850 [Acidimicrobiales bacterium]|jgi:hypothetical protein|nr:hypothetical protein [Actinomycetota bacterium]MDP6177716.1 hypothetical protein [Acidimicrobiales bacterium]MDP6280374.1 hypothetical protein [Acidimicrobiales bacterium]MDP7116804.1 hypothetical protein [Acidimicrobiales bacterium]MDP7411511.1 hypothetical protein [Acidimicrobiales bacterium]
MADLTGPFLPSTAERELNQLLRAQHMEFLLGQPDWAPSGLERWPDAVVRFHNRLVPRLPMTGPLGWLDGTTRADELERERVDALPADEQAEARLLHARAVHFRCIRTTRVPVGEQAD